MSRLLFWTGIGLFIIWVIKASGIIVAASLFLLAGVIPGTSWSLPPTTMLIVLAVMLALVLYWMKKQKLAHQIKELKAKHQAPAKTTRKITRSVTSRPRARYSQPKVATRSVKTAAVR